MVNPTGYTALDMIGFTDKGAYNVATNYVKNDLVHYNGIVWRVLIDDTIGITPAEGVNYTVFVESPNSSLTECIAPTEQVTATAAHLAGSQLFYNDKLYKVIADIDVGDTLTIGTNIALAPDITSQIGSIIQQSVFTVAEVSGKWHLYWHGADSECPFSVTQSGTDFNLAFTYNT